MFSHIKMVGEEIVAQTVEEHLEGAAAIGRRTGKNVGIENMAFIACLFHDMGKNKKEFDDYLKKAVINNEKVIRGSVDHSTAGGKYLYETAEKNDILGEIAAELLSTAVFSHHGLMDMKSKSHELFSDKLEKADEKTGYIEALENCKELISKYDVNRTINLAEKEFKKIYKKIFGLAAEIDCMPSNKPKRKDIFFLIGCLQRLLTSIVMDSDRKNTAEFMTGIEPENIDHNKLWEDYAERLNRRLSGFKNVNKITALRRKMSDECFEFARNESGIYCLPVPTGGGKTLASFRFALEHCKRYKKERIIYTAPFLSILEQNAEEIRNVLQDDKHILEHHSNIVIENNGENYNERNVYKYLSDTWDSPVILTTMVRFLDVLFGGNSSDVRRFCKICNSVIIIDEVQNIPVKILNLFNIMMNFLSRICNSTVVLCSATQPLLDRTRKPILYGSPKDMIKNVNEVSDVFRRTRIIDKTEGGEVKINTCELADFVTDMAEDNILVILNTKSAVRKLYDELLSRNIDYEIYQLTTYMCPQHRKNIISDIKLKLGKQKIICISTQLIEAGVDISFKNVIRSLSGLDSIIQAAGRCNRNGSDDIREVYIVDYKEEKVNSLEDIKKAQEAMRDNVLPYYKNHMEEGQDWLLSREAADRFYEVYFFQRKEEMYYNIENKVTMYDFLSSYQLNKGEIPQVTNRYESAGEAFKVIDNNTIGVIVPYKEGKEKAEKLLETDDLTQTKKLLKELQRYTVSVYKTGKILEELKEKKVLIPCLDESVYILSEGYYDENTGIKTEMMNYIF